MPATTGDGVRRLREARGGERVTFDEVADHMDDYCARRPESVAVLDGFAGFLAGVEQLPHRHPERQG
jgi:hypothetical protein